MSDRFPPRRPQPDRGDDEVAAELERAFAELRRQRPEIPVEVHDRARDRGVDALLRGSTAWRFADGRPIRLRIKANARRLLIWELQSYQRTRLNPDGSRKPHPKGATSLETHGVSGPGKPAAPLGDQLAAKGADPAEIIADRERAKSLLRAIAAADKTTRAIMVGYLQGKTAPELAAETDLSVDAVYQRKCRFERGLGEAA